MQPSTLDTAIATMLTHPSYKHSYMFYGFLLAKCRKELTSDVNIAGVSFQHTSYVLHVNPETFSRYSTPQQLAILKHEMLHILNGHLLSRRGERDHQQWNYATDCAINQLIDHSHLIQGAITPSNFPVPCAPYLSSEAYYDLLEGNMPPPPDSHPTWSQSCGDPDFEKDLTRSMIESAISRTSKLAGSLPSQLSRYLDIFTRKSEVNWQYFLRQAFSRKSVESRHTIMRRDRRFPLRDDLRGTTRIRKSQALVICDVSGSMSDAAISHVLGELHHLAARTHTHVNLIQIDTEPHPPELLTARTKTFTRKACGGTALFPAIQMASDHHLTYDVVIIATDGGITRSDADAFLTLGKPLVWLVDPTGSTSSLPTSGKSHVFKLKG